jgi:hypothetical protein
VARASEVAKCKDPANCGFADVAQDVDQLQRLQIPLGWTGNAEKWPDDPLDFGVKALLKLLGLLMTAAAVTLGAPFWFDMLSKVARIRSAGAPPPATDAKRTGEGEEDRLGPKTASL